MNNVFIVVKDEEGILRPQAGIWRANDAGEQSARVYEKNNPTITLRLCELTDLEQY